MKLGRVGACLAFLSSILLVAALPSTALAHGDERGYRHGAFSVWLTPGQVPGGGDRGASGFARLTLDEERELACYVLEWRHLEGFVTAAHLHVASRGENGPHAIDLFNDEHFDGERNGVWNCVRVRDDRGHEGHMSAREKIRDIIANPEDFYINIHTTRYKDGAIRGQLG
jgi:hypothetical protein